VSAQWSILAASLLLLGPGALLGSSLLPRGTLAERVAIGAAFGLAASITIGYGLAALDRLDAFAYVYVAMVAGAAVSVVALRRTPDRPRDRCDPGEAVALSFGISAAVVFFLVPTLATQAPIGWDPAFHSILAEKVRLANGLVSDWEPFEHTALNYPLGSHLWIALIANVTGEPVHHVFQVQHAVVQVLSSLLLYSVARRMLSSFRPALFAMLCYALVGEFGTFQSYYQWGGLPTEMGFAAFLALVWTALFLRERAWIPLGILFYGSTVMIHHLSALIVTVVLVGYVGLSFVARADAEIRRRIIWIGLGAALAYAPVIVPFALGAQDLSGTDVLQLREEPRTSLFALADNLGFAVVALGAFGLWSVRREDSASINFLFAWTAVLFAAYAGLDYGYRAYAQWAWGRDITAFTPSRFATVLSYPLCIAAGSTLERLRVLLARRLPERVTVAAVVLAMAAFAAPRATALAERRAFDAQAEQAGAFVRGATPPDAFVVYRQRIAPGSWVPYLTWRAGFYTPLPASEDRRSAHQRRAKLRLAAKQPGGLRRILASEGKTPWAYSRDENGRPHVEPIP